MVTVNCGRRLTAEHAMPTHAGNSTIPLVVLVTRYLPDAGGPMMQRDGNQMCPEGERRRTS